MCSAKEADLEEDRIFRIGGWWRHRKLWTFKQTKKETFKAPARWPIFHPLLWIKSCKLPIKSVLLHRPRTQVTFYFFFLVSLKSICECHSNFLNFRPRKVERQKLQDDDDDTLLYLCLFFSLFVCLNLYFKSIYLTLYCLKTSKTVKGGRAVALSFFLSFLFVSALFQNIFRRLSRFKTLLSVSLHTPLFKLCDVPLHQINLSSFVYKSCLFFSIFGRCKIRQNTSAKGLVV